MSLRIGILGAGHVGGALGRLWAAKGHDIQFGKRGSSNGEAAASAQVVVLTVPWPAAQDAIKDCGDLAGKILVDCTNPLTPDLKGLSVGLTTSAAEQVALWAPGAKVVKAFNTIGAVDFGNADFGGVVADGFYCGDDDASKKVVAALISDTGMNPVDIGPLRNARLLEPLALLWIDLAVIQKQGPNHAFKLLRR
ncbi:MAG TPA: NADPH-dependent F420 reductase [Bryobacteraceae bacterium]|jgi:predicted dinucleotide-binding enzyme|nr:NADPH-dependent F420 reductase [Bryobacteraceae bacterium]